MSDERLRLDSGPVTEAARIISLDLIRGVAVLGILLMNAVSFKYGLPPYLNLNAGGSETPLDWAIGIGGEIFVDQKFMGLFSLLFGAGIILFIERAETRATRPALLNLWRNALLLGIGILHTLLWDGDVLVVYAIAALFLIALRRLSARWLNAVGVFIFLLSVPAAFLMQYIADATGAPLYGIWELADSATATAPGPGPAQETGYLPPGLTAAAYFARGLGLAPVGAGLYRLGFMQGSMPDETYRRVAGIGLGIGLPMALAGVIVTHLGDYAAPVAFSGQIPNTLGTIPAALGYMSLIILWSRRGDSWLKRRLAAAGRMALTNYLSQTVLGILTLSVLLGDVSVSRTGILIFCLAVWALQLWWSSAWLSRFRFGPAEWLWRVATYCRGQQLRRAGAQLGFN